MQNSLACYKWTPSSSLCLLLMEFWSDIDRNCIAYIRILLYGHLSTQSDVWSDICQKWLEISDSARIRDSRR